MATLAPQNGIVDPPLRHCFKGSWIDRILLLLSLAGILLSWQWIHAAVSSGPPQVMIYHNSTLLARYPIPQNDETIHFHAAGELGDSEILINKNGARFVSSPCTSQYCVLRGQHREHGDVIACVPNRIMIAIEASNEADALDAIVE